MSLIVNACSSSQQVIKSEEKTSQDFLKINHVYSELDENSYNNLYFFNSENNTVYFSKYKVNDTINKINKLKTTFFGEYKVENNTVKIQRYIPKTVKVSSRNFIESIIFTFPLPTPRTEKKEITIVGKEIITEGEIKGDTIVMKKMYFGTKKLNFEKKRLSKSHNVNSILICEPKFKGVIKKDNIYDNYKVEIIEN